MPIFHYYLTSGESNDHQTFDWMNSIKFKASLLVCKTLDYQTLNKCINASVVILPIEKCKLLNQAYSARRRCLCQALRGLFSLQEKGMTAKLSMGIIQ